MKTKILVALLVITSLTSFKLAPDNKATATVERQEGLLIFMLSKPVADYEYLGTVKIKAAWTGEPTEMLNISIKKVKKEYPQAEAIIFTSVGMDKADAIKFK